MNASDLRVRVQYLATKAQEVYNDPDKTQAEKATQLEKIQTDITDTQAQLKAVESSDRINKSITDMVGSELEPLGAAPQATGVKTAVADDDGRSPGATFTNSAGYKAVKGSRSQFSTGDVDVKVVGTVDETTLGAALVTPQYLPGIVGILTQPLVVSDLFAQGATDSPQISYVIESAWQNLAGTVAEAGLKPQSDLTFARRNEALSKIANRFKVTDEMFEDVQQLESYINQRAVLGVRQVEQAQVLNGNGTAPNLRGIMQRTGLQTTVVAVGGAGLSNVDALFNQITNIRSAFGEPDAMVINPSDWQKLRLSKDANGQYFAGGPFTGAYGVGGFTAADSLWGKRVVVTQAIAAGTALVGSFQQGGQVFRKGGITLEATNSNEDDFNKDLVSLRCEERIVLAVQRPNWFGLVTIA